VPDGGGKGTDMPDIAYIVLTLAVFALAFLVLKGVERL
jgi:hypothetical protein